MQEDKALQKSTLFSLKMQVHVAVVLYADTGWFASVSCSTKKPRFHVGSQYEVEA